MLAFNQNTKLFEPFGNLKTASISVKDKDEKSNLNPCFVVFDLLLLNGKSLEYPWKRDTNTFQNCLLGKVKIG